MALMGLYGHCGQEPNTQEPDVEQVEPNNMGQEHQGLEGEANLMVEAQAQEIALGSSAVNQEVPAEANHPAEQQLPQGEQSSDPVDETHDFLRNISSYSPVLAINPVVAATARAKKTKGAEASTLRRSRRIASTGGMGTAIDQAQTVLMRKLGLIMLQERLSQEARDAYMRLFDHPLSRDHLTALASLFGWTVPDDCEMRSPDHLLY